MPAPPRVLFQQPTLQEKLLHRSTLSAPPLWLAKPLGVLINPDKPLVGEGEMGEQAQFAVGPLENQSG